MSCTGNPDRSEVTTCFEDFCKQTILHGWHYLAEKEDRGTWNNG